MTETVAVEYRHSPEVVFPPGETLAELLAERGIAQAEFVGRTGLTAERVNLIVNGQAPITAELAELLERETGVSAAVWANLEATFRAHEARQSDGAHADQGLVAGAPDRR